MMITTLGLALGVLFLLIPLCVAYVYHIDMVTRMLRAFFCMALRVGVLGVAVYYLVQTNSLTLSLLAALVFMLYSVVVVSIGHGLIFHYSCCLYLQECW